MAPSLSKERVVKALTHGNRMKVDPNKLSGELKDWLAVQIIDGRMTTREISDRLSIKRNTLQKWAQKYKKGICNHGESKGRPRVISNKASEALARQLRRGDFQVDQIEYAEHLQEALRATAEEYKKDPDIARMPSPSTIARMEKRAHIRTTTNAEVNTNARAEGESPRAKASRKRSREPDESAWMLLLA
eukprot:gene3235-3544_t